MPLVVPGIMTNPEDKTQEWANKLVGKTFSESESNETVSAFPTLQSRLYFVTPLSLPYERGNLDQVNDTCADTASNRCSARKTCRRRIASSSPGNL